MRSDGSGGEAKDGTSYLEGEDASGIHAAAKRGKLEGLWHAAYGRSQRYRTSESQTPSSSKAGGAAAFGIAGDTASRTAGQEEAAECPPEGTRAVQGIEEGGRGDEGGDGAARAECGLDEADEGMDPGKAVGQMFGLM